MDQKPEDNYQAASVEEDQPQPHNYRMIVITALVILLLIGGVYILRDNQLRSLVNPSFNLPFGQQGQSATDSQDNDIPLYTIDDESQAWLKVQVDESLEPVVGAPLAVTLTGNSQGADISGYDILFGYDPAIIEVVSVESLHPDFQIFTFDKDTHTTITGVKNLQQTATTVFQGEELLRITVQPKEKVNTPLTVYTERGNERTQFVDSNVQVIVPQIGSTLLEIR